MMSTFPASSKTICSPPSSFVGQRGAPPPPPALTLYPLGGVDQAPPDHRPANAPSDDHLETASVETEESQQWKAALFREATEYLNQGFQQAAMAGPMCGEPMVGVAFIVDELEFYQPRPPTPLGVTPL